MNALSGPARIAAALADVLPWIVVAVLVFNMSQRRFMDVGVRKRLATLQIAGLFGLLWAATITIEHFGVSDLLLLPVLALLAVLTVARRDTIFIHRTRCRSCGARLPLGRILYHDDPRCASCDEQARPSPGTKE